MGVLDLDVRPTSELVVVAWIASIEHFSSDMVATTLPPDTNKDGTPAAWVRTGFVTAAAVGGTPNDSLPVKRPVMQIDCWATVPGSNKPPWGEANALAEAIRYAALDPYNVARPLTIGPAGTAYPQARVLSAVLQAEPRRIPGDPGKAARYQFDMAFQWVTIGDRLN
ncbi:MAG: hypothetical protein JWO67_6717 [Streptosporangiaceae bacterium]|nr:hypothetical protein [Streptosporangiaceae bacterium]